MCIQHFANKMLKITKHIYFKIGKLPIWAVLSVFLSLTKNEFVTFKNCIYILLSISKSWACRAWIFCLIKSDPDQSWDLLVLIGGGGLGGRIKKFLHPHARSNKFSELQFIKFIFAFDLNVLGKVIKINSSLTGKFFSTQTKTEGGMQRPVVHLASFFIIQFYYIH